jgi:hypothetical protein
MTLNSNEPTDQREVNELPTYIRENRAAINVLEAGVGTPTNVASAFNVEEAITVEEATNVDTATTVTNAVNVNDVDDIGVATNIEEVSGGAITTATNIEEVTGGTITTATTVEDATTVSAATTVTNASTVTTATTVTSASAVQNATTVEEATGTITDATTISLAYGSSITNVDTLNEVTDEISDDDGDTKIQCEEGADDDTIRFDAAGAEIVTIDSNGLHGILADDDGDTKIQCEEGADEDIIRLDSAGAEAVRIGASTRTYIQINANDTSDQSNHGGYAFIATASREFTMNGATENWSSFFRDGVIVFGVTARVTELITGCTGIDIGVQGGDTDIFIDGMGVALDTVAGPEAANDPTLLPYYHVAGGTPSLQITAMGGGGSFTAGKLRVEVHYMSIGYPTS